MASRRGLHRTERLLVVGVVAILGLLALIVINPARRLGEARDLQRQHDVQLVRDALHAYRQRSGRLPDGISTTPKELCVQDAPSCSNALDLSMLLKEDLSALPKDPLSTGTGTMYTVARDAFQRIIVSAPSAELQLAITAIR